MKKILLFTLVCLSTMSAWAQDDYEENGHALPPYNFIGIQGGVQNTFNNEFNNLKTFTPTATFSFGRWFSPVVGMRLGVNGAWAKSGVNYLQTGLEDGHYNYNYVTPSADVLVNLCTLFGKKNWYPVNLFFVGGLGANYAFENYYRSEEKALGSTMLYYDNDSRWAFNGRVGLGLDVPLCKYVSFNLEADLNARCTGKSEVFNDDILQVTLQAGFNFKFGHKKRAQAGAPGVMNGMGDYADGKNAESIAADPVYVTRVDTIWYEDVTYQDKDVNEKAQWNIYYDINKSDLPDAAKEIQSAIDFVKSHKGAKVIVTGYADKETGNPRLNLELSKQRAEKVKKALIAGGVSSDAVSVDYKGDTVQPFAENERNRVSIITLDGQGTQKERVVTKKFRTKEVRERVN